MPTRAHNTYTPSFSVQRQGPDVLLWSALLLSRTSRLLRDLVWRIHITLLRGEAISCLMNMMLWKRNLGFHKESFHFREGVIKILSASIMWKTEEFSYDQITCAHVDILDEVWQNNSSFPGFSSCKHTRCLTEGLFEIQCLPQMTGTLII